MLVIERTDKESKQHAKRSIDRKTKRVNTAVKIRGISDKARAKNRRTSSEEEKEKKKDVKNASEY